MKIEWFDATEAVRFGDSLADFFIERIPLNPGDKDKSRKLEKQFGVVDKMLSQVEQFKARNKLNVYKKAKLAGAFKEKLTGAGYDSRLVDEVTLGIVKAL
jgi:hypothetical protein